MGDGRKWAAEQLDKENAFDDKCESDQTTGRIHNVRVELGDIISTCRLLEVERSELQHMIQLLDALTGNPRR